MSNYASTSTSTSQSHSRASSASCSRTTTLPKPHTFKPTPELKGKIVQHVRADKYLQQIGEVATPGDPGSREEVEGGKKVGKRKAREEVVERERKRLEHSGMGRERVTQRMVRCLNPLGRVRIAHADVGPDVDIGQGVEPDHQFGPVHTVRHLIISDARDRRLIRQDGPLRVQRNGTSTVKCGRWKRWNGNVLGSPECQDARAGPREGESTFRSTKWSVEVEC